MEYEHVDRKKMFAEWFLNIIKTYASIYICLLVNCYFIEISFIIKNGLE